MEGRRRWPEGADTRKQGSLGAVLEVSGHTDHTEGWLSEPLVNGSEMPGVSAPGAR